MFICWLISPYFFSLCACNWQSNVGSCRSDCQCRCRYRDQYRRVSSTYNFVFSFLSLLFDFSLSHLLVTPYFVLVAYSSPLSSPLLLFFSSLKLPLSPPPRNYFSLLQLQERRFDHEQQKRNSQRRNVSHRDSPLGWLTDFCY